MFHFSQRFHMNAVTNKQCATVKSVHFQKFAGLGKKDHHRHTNEVRVQFVSPRESMILHVMERLTLSQSVFFHSVEQMFLRVYL